MRETPIRLIRSGLDVSQAVAQLDACPSAWDRHTMRTAGDTTPHKTVSDVWVRYNDWANFDGDPAAFNGPHESVWYPIADELPAVKALALDIYREVGGGTLGGVLITRIPPGEMVKPHRDSGWHAAEHEKFAVQLRGNSRQAFCFNDARLVTYPGDLYTFDNSQEHWVTNNSCGERITMIVCVKRDSA